SNPDIITKYQYSSNFLGIKVDKSDDWCFTMKDGYIDRMCAGGENCYQEVGIAYITPNDSKQLLKDIKELYKTDEGKKRLWEYTLFNEYKEHYKVEVRECKKEDIIEIDTFDELKALDKSYNV
ncbi:MAG: CTP--phosphocholine cytidylyltransferase, partial [Clostridia bacterium]|nr:CTP--phosphocholine cytidylyltransferase [Clostridia bacterium]